MTEVTAPRVAVRMLGGTICMASSVAGAPATPIEDAGGLIDQIPALRRRASLDVAVHQRLPGASLGVADARLVADLLGACQAGAQGVVVTQGTDTLEEVAFVVDLLWPRVEPVVFTGAMRPADAVGADGPANLLAAVTVAASPRSRGRGTLVVFADEVHRAESVRKQHTSSPGAFASVGGGAAGHVSEGAVHYFATTSRRAGLPLSVDLTAAPDSLPRVALLKLSLGADTILLEHAVSTSDAVVVEAFGAGHVPSWWVDPLAEAARAVPVVLASRTGDGPVLASTYGFAGSEQQLLSAGLLSAHRLDGCKARLAMLLALLASDGPAAAADLFESYAASADIAQRHATDSTAARDEELR